jgi:hypothetical protein
MAYQQPQSEWTTLFTQIHAYERVTGLTALKIEPDTTSVRVEWGYPDATWAGTNIYDLPLDEIIQKLEQQVSHEQKRVQLGLPKRDTGELPKLELLITD